MRNKKSGSVNRVGSAMAHRQGSLHTPIEGQAHPPKDTSAHTHRAAVGDTGVQKFPGTGGHNSAHDTCYSVDLARCVQEP